MMVSFPSSFLHALLSPCASFAAAAELRPFDEMLKVTPDDLFFGLGVNRSCHRTSRHMTLYTAAHVRNWLLGVHLMLHYLAMVYQPGIEDLKLTEFSLGFHASEASVAKFNENIYSCQSQCLKITPKNLLLQHFERSYAIFRPNKKG